MIDFVEDSKAIQRLHDQDVVSPPKTVSREGKAQVREQFHVQGLKETTLI